MFTIDLVALLDRINKLENENTEIRQLIAQTSKELSNEIEEARQSAIDALPELKDGKLVFESYDAKGDTVYGHVIAEIKSDQADA